ncbi:flagellar filament capping protein FliD [Shewanella sedimentimangrovi]|uniref:Flagellar hook-associated protein 2 n=1 Tax=Shewanella sedimentimangrovi TaxID=2814293 RepID=A0ABX7QYE4_9GAMM|nr:flagellar filament capping protein FliD [Shewanella sedimentimangrovi]QSX36082.1 flagellar filament capping protein FliD [Shewanella sedimentimangrovi]
MALTATGIGSNLPINDIVSAIVNAEKAPKEALFARNEQTIEAKVSAMGTLKSELSKFQDALKKLQTGDNLNLRKISTGDSIYFKATADKTAQSGSYGIKVEQLATKHKVGGAYTTDASQTVGEGRLDFTVNGNGFGVDIAATDSLSAIASKINDASDNVGVTATIVTSDAGSRLVLTSNTEGTDSQISVTATDTSGTGLNDMFNGANLTELQPAANSIIYIDGDKVTSQTNEVKDAIAGVTLSLTDADVNKTSTLTIEQDTDAVKSNIKEFVDAYNSLMSSIDKLSSYDADTKKAAALQGDSMIRGLESQLRSMISERVDIGGGETLALYDMGIKTDRYGKLSIDDTKLDSAIKNDMGKIEGLFSTTDTGLANRLESLANGYVKSGGLIQGRNNSYTSDKQRIADQKEAFTLKMEQLEARLYKQFNHMDLVVASLNQQSSGLADRLNSLPGVVRE